MIAVVLIGSLIMVDHARRGAETRFRQVHRLAHAVIFDYQDAIAGLPGSTPVRARLVQDALGYLEKLSAEANTPDLEREIVEGYTRISKVQGDSYGSNLGDTAGSLASIHRAIAASQHLLGADQTPASLKAAADAFSVQASLFFSSGKLEAAAADYRTALDLRNRAAKPSPGDIENALALADIDTHLGDLDGATGLQNLGRSRQAAVMYGQADAILTSLQQRFPANLEVTRQRFEVLLQRSEAIASLVVRFRHLHPFRQRQRQMSETITTTRYYIVSSGFFDFDIRKHRFAESGTRMSKSIHQVSHNLHKSCVSRLWLR